MELTESKKGVQAILVRYKEALEAQDDPMQAAGPKQRAAVAS
jgi:hypothetical protein